ncbi:MAG: mechanosensitive ion channel family protein [Phycisphaeraceae bacterium]|nr:mechanosensitive ion channel family protein [Phycisphaeraceae bacterium]
MSTLLSRLWMIVVVTAFGIVAWAAVWAIADSATQPTTDTDPTTSPAANIQPAATPIAEPKEPATPQPLIGRHQDELAARAIEGDWLNTDGADRMRLSFLRGGGFRLDNIQGTYWLDSNRLYLRSSGGHSYYNYDLTADTLTLSGGDLKKDAKFTKQSNFLQYARGLLDFSPTSVKRKFVRIASILAIVVLARLIIFAIRLLLTFLVTSDRGPLRLFWRHRKSRILTIHSLVLNVIAYAIYFTAAGFVLSELGINYTTYIASLSVIGLAIGFGSQGLVQDMVTGMFVIFEEQFDVGDMVEISGQIGVVEELGLRSTKLYNFFGQAVIIPNRFIAVVGNFRKGAQIATVDVAIAASVDTQSAMRVLTRTAEEMAKQYKGAIVAPPEPVGPIAPGTGERFLRIHVPIWPQQTWVIDQQFVPRTLEAFKQENIEIPANRITVYYHARESKRIMNWRDLVSNIRSRFEDQIRDWDKHDDGDGGTVDV